MLFEVAYLDFFFVVVAYLGVLSWEKQLWMFTSQYCTLIIWDVHL